MAFNQVLDRLQRRHRTGQMIIQIGRNLFLFHFRIQLNRFPNCKAFVSNYFVFAARRGQRRNKVTRAG
jgi:hypothetical protein